MPNKASLRRKKMETIKVKHTGFGDNGDTVALIEVDEKWSLHEKLSYAWRWTNSIEGSWWEDEVIEYEGKTFINSDYNPNVTAINKRYSDEGELWGHRSSAVGDQVVIGNETYVVARFGWKTLAGEKVK
tara:strand:+ start:103 stop:489 length:387 start_codon:yes stop_codon:yes gene_type:complete